MRSQDHVSDLFDRALKSCTAATPQEASEVFILCWKILLRLDTAKPVLLTMTTDELFEYRLRLLIRTASHFGFEPKDVAVFIAFSVEPKW